MQKKGKTKMAEEKRADALFAINASDSMKPCFDKLRRMFDGYPGATTREKAEAYVKELGFTDADIARFSGIMLGK